MNIYTNDTQVQTSPWDLRFSFGVLKDLDLENRTLDVERVAELRMSPQHAKRIVAIITNQLAMYERTYGPIPVTENES